jgi:hypothetical protein
MGPIEPIFHPTPILSLRPTQITLGYEEVRAKRDSWKTKTAEQLSGFLRSHLVPTILGPGRQLYLIDHHHLARALHEEGVEQLFVTTVADLSRLTKDHFWTVMDMRGWTHPYDPKGRRRPYSDLPTTVEGMEDDPYRSLAGELRNVGGFAKDSTPFAEFLWADFLRPRFKVKAIRADFQSALAKAVLLSKTGDADYLPGWCGPHGFVGAGAPAPAAVPAKKPSKTKKAKRRQG